jgi:lipoprotein-anchoring transpeptidase ErfK/SrfK
MDADADDDGRESAFATLGAGWTSHEPAWRARSLPRRRLYHIHGTDAPWTIGTAISKGCMRMYNEDVLDLYPRASVGGKVRVTWQRFDSAS